MSGTLESHVSNAVSRQEMLDAGEIAVRDLVARYEITEAFDPYRYVPPGPVASEFILDRSLTSVIMGPLGGGKTTACVFKRIYAATLAPIAWHPDDHKPTRMCRWIVLRDTFRSVEKTVLESWKQWFPKGYPGSTWAGGNDRPVTHALRFMGQDGVRVEAITEFAGLGEMNVGDLMKGREYSGAWLNEIDTHAAGALDDMEQRVGRYPKADIILTDAQLIDLGRKLGHPVVSGGSRMRFVIGDMNAPTIDNWTFPVLVTERKPDRSFHQQPSGRSAEAENRFNLEPDYYQRIIDNQEEYFIRRMVDNKFGYSRAGKAVYASFEPNRNIAPSIIRPDQNIDLHIGIDISMNSLSPAGAFLQPRAPGRIVVLDELYLGHGVGAARFGEGLQQKLASDYPNIEPRRVKLWADPASQYGADREGGQLTALETISIILGIPVLVPANGSNELGMRLDAVRAEIRGYLEPESWLWVSPNCKVAVEGFLGGYKFKKKKESASSEFEDLPDKSHPISDVQDAIQYGVLGIRGRTGAMHGAASGRSQGNSSSWRSQSGGRKGHAGGFDPHKAGSRR